MRRSGAGKTSQSRIRSTALLKRRAESVKILLRSILTEMPPPDGKYSAYHFITLIYEHDSIERGTFSFSRQSQSFGGNPLRWAQQVCCAHNLFAGCEQIPHLQPYLYFSDKLLKMKLMFHFEKEKQRNECSPLTLERKAIWSLLRRHAGAKNRFDFVSSLWTKFCEAFL